MSILLISKEPYLSHGKICPETEPYNFLDSWVLNVSLGIGLVKRDINTFLVYIYFIAMSFISMVTHNLPS